MLLEEIDGDSVVVRVQATPERRSDGARLADEIIAALVTRHRRAHPGRLRRARQLNAGSGRDRLGRQLPQSAGRSRMIGIRRPITSVRSR